MIARPAALTIIDRIGYRWAGPATAAVVATVLSALTPPVVLGQAIGTVAGRLTFENVPQIGEFHVSDAVVYLLGEGLSTDLAATLPPTEPPLLDQQNYTFVPRVLPVMAGVEITFHNSDDEVHNIHTRSKGRRRNRVFNQAQKPNSLMSTIFQRPDSIRVMCDIHSQMIAHILVLPNPFFTKAGEDGTYSIAGVPPGRYELVAWHEFYGTVTSAVEVVAGEATTANLTMAR